MLLFHTEKIAGAQALFEEQEAVHMRKVLRKRIGDTVQWTDGKGHLYSGPITSISKRQIIAHIEHQTPWSKTWKHNIHLSVCPTKNIQRTEWMIEKLCELGIDTLTLVIAQNSERRSIKMDKLKRKVISACTQSLKGRFPVLQGPLSFSDYLEEVGPDPAGCIGHCRASLPPMVKHPSLLCSQDVHVLIGPEGDFTAQEVERAVAMGWTEVSLGEARLRTETAALVACQTVHFLETYLSP